MSGQENWSTLTASIRSKVLWSLRDSKPELKYGLFNSMGVERTINLIFNFGRTLVVLSNPFIIGEELISSFASFNCGVFVDFVNAYLLSY